MSRDQLYDAAILECRRLRNQLEGGIIPSNGDMDQLLGLMRQIEKIEVKRARIPESRQVTITPEKYFELMEA